MVDRAGVLHHERHVTGGRGRGRHVNVIGPASPLVSPNVTFTVVAGVAEGIFTPPSTMFVPAEVEVELLAHPARTPTIPSEREMREESVSALHSLTSDPPTRRRTGRVRTIQSCRCGSLGSNGPSRQSDPQ